jgi:hypothetical protein
LAYHFHWSYKEILAMEHADRRRWCAEISKINKAMNSDDKTRNFSNLGA